MQQAIIDTDEWMEVWHSTSVLENKVKELKDENRILNDRMLQLEFRIQQLEEKHNE